METLKTERFLFHLKTKIKLQMIKINENYALNYNLIEKDSSNNKYDDELFLLITTENFYFFLPDSINNEDSFLIENYLYLKLPFEHCFLVMCDELNRIVKYTTRDLNTIIEIQFIDIFKESFPYFVNILIFLEGYKNYCFIMDYDYTSYLDWICFIIDNYVNFCSILCYNYYFKMSVVTNSNICYGRFNTNTINNSIPIHGFNSCNYITNNNLINFKANTIGDCLFIDKEFFSINKDALQFILHFLNRIEKYEFSIKINDDEDIDYIKFIFITPHPAIKSFIQKKENNSKQDENNINLNNNNLNDFSKSCNINNELSKMYFTKIIKFSYNNIDDNKFFNLIEFFVVNSCNNLLYLEVSNNKLSSESLAVFSRIFIGKKYLTNLEVINFSNNLINSCFIKEFFYNTLIYTKSLKEINLQNNYLDNDCLLYLDMILRNNIKLLCKIDITLDLRGNKFDNILFRSKFIDWSPSFNIKEDIENSYTLSHFLLNLKKMKLNLTIKIDIIKHFEELKEFSTNIASNNIVIRSRFTKLIGIKTILLILLLYNFFKL